MPRAEAVGWRAGGLVIHVGWFVRYDCVEWAGVGVGVGVGDGCGWG